MSAEYEGTMRWFGRPFDSPMYEGMPKADMLVVGIPCTMCREPILVDEPGITMPHGMADGVRILPQHIECHLRSILGSPAHLDNMCSCVSGEHEQPSGLTFRQEAREVIKRTWGEDWLTR